MKKIKNFLLYLLSGGFIFLVSMLLFSFSKIQYIDLIADLKIQNQVLYKSKELKVREYLNNYKDQYLWRIDLKKIVKKIESIYSGGEIHIKRKFPNRLRLFLKEKQTFLLLLKQDQFFYSISKEGYIGAKKRNSESLNFPILRGRDFEKNFQLRKRVLKVLLLLPKTGKFFSLENISEILYNKETNSLLFYLVSDYFIVDLKEPPSLKKIKNINFVLNYLRIQGQSKAFIDASLDKKIVVKKLK